MGEKPTEAETSRVTEAAGLPASRRRPRRLHSMNALRLSGVIAPLLGVTLLLAGCQNQGADGNGERRDGFYGGISGGWTRP